MSNSRADIVKNVAEGVVKYLSTDGKNQQVDISTITEETSFKNDLNLDSFDMTEVCLVLEDTFKQELEIDEFLKDDIKVKDIVDYLVECTV